VNIFDVVAELACPDEQERVVDELIRVSSNLDEGMWLSNFRIDTFTMICKKNK